MSAGLRTLQLPLLVEQRRKHEEEASGTVASVAAGETTDGLVSSTYYQHQNWQHQQTNQYQNSMTGSTSSEVTSPATPTFSARGHLRYSSSMSSFDLTRSASCEELASSPTLPLPTSSKRVLHDVEEEPFEYEHFNQHYVEDINDADDYMPEHFDLYDCLCHEPCAHKDPDLGRGATNFYARDFYAGEGDMEYDLGCISDGESPPSPRLSRRTHHDGSMSPFMGFSYRLSSRLPSFSRWRSPRKSSTVSSTASEINSEDRSMSRAASSRSSSISGSNRHLPDRSNEPPLPPTPALSFYESSDSITLPGAFDVEKADNVLSAIQRERAQATTPLLPPLMTGNSADHLSAQPSPLQSPTVASPLDDEPQSPLILSPTLSTRPSISSFRHIKASGELPPIPVPDSWSDRLGHANFTIQPVPYKPETASLSSLFELRADWDTARINYTKHLVRTGEHYGITSKTYAYTEEKWADTDRIWRAYYDQIANVVEANGDVTICNRFDESIITTVPIMDGEGKFPERGDEDIVGPMVREADRKRPGFWRNLTDRVNLRK